MVARLRQGTGPHPLVHTCVSDVGRVGAEDELSSVSHHVEQVVLVHLCVGQGGISTRRQFEAKGGNWGDAGRDGRLRKLFPLSAPH